MPPELLRKRLEGLGKDPIERYPQIFDGETIFMCCLWRCRSRRGGHGATQTSKPRREMLLRAKCCFSARPRREMLLGAREASPRVHGRDALNQRADVGGLRPSCRAGLRPFCGAGLPSVLWRRASSLATRETAEYIIGAPADSLTGHDVQVRISNC